MQNVNVGSLVKNPGQQRTKLNPEKLAQLATQIAERGLDPDHPILVTPDEGGDYRIVRGHRRTMAYVIAQRAMADNNYSIEELVNALATETHTEYLCTECGESFAEKSEVCPECGTEDSLFAEEIEEVNPKMLADSFNKLIAFADRNGFEMPVMVQEYESEKEEQLDLIADAFGAEDPDIVGQAQAFHRAIELDASLQSVAFNTGLKRDKVEDYVSLAEAPEYIQRAVEAGRLLLSHVGKIARVEKHGWREALYRLADLTPDVTHEMLNQWIATIKNWNPTEVNMLDEQTPWEKNDQRIEALAYEKGKVNEAYWMAVATGDQEDRLYAAGIEPENLHELLPCLSCETCQLREVLQDIPENRFYPCSQGDDVEFCRGAVGPDDEFLLRSAWGRFPEMKVIDQQGFWTTPEEAITFFEEKEEEKNEEPEPEEEEEVFDAMAQLQFFMATHRDHKGVDHGLGVTCLLCSLKTEDGCLMESNPRNVDFSVLLPDRDYIIPQCSKYMSTATWAERIPHKATVKPMMTVAQMERVIKLVATQIQMKGERVLPSLVGTPMEGKPEVFTEVYEREAQTLSPVQTMNLMKWVVARWHELEYGEIPLEMPAGLELDFTREEYPRYDAEE